MNLTTLLSETQSRLDAVQSLCQCLERELQAIHKAGALAHEIETARITYDFASQIRIIQAVVAQEFRITVAEITSRARHHAVAFPRMVAISLVRELTLALPDRISPHFGHLHQATILYAARAIRDRLDTEPYFKRRYDTLRSNLIATLNPQPQDPRQPPHVP